MNTIISFIYMYICRNILWHTSHFGKLYLPPYFMYKVNKTHKWPLFDQDTCTCMHVIIMYIDTLKFIDIQTVIL